MSNRARQAAGVALTICLCLAGTARADDDLVADLNGDGRADRVSVVKSSSGDVDRLRLTFAGGRTRWLRLSKPVQHVAAADVDRDGDIDLVATTDGAELHTWFNRGRGHFAHRVVSAHAPSLLARPGPGLARLVPHDETTPAMGNGDAILGASIASTLITTRQPLRHSTPAGIHRTYVPFGSRAPPVL